MGSSYYGEPNMGNERSGGSSRKGKKSNSDKPKQPQRGLGVAQLEKIRIHSQMGCSYLPHPYPNSFNPQQEDMRVHGAYASSCVSSSSSSSGAYGFQPNIMMGMGELERSNFRYAADSQASPTARWNPSNGILESQHFAQPSNMTRHFLNLQDEDSLQKKRKKERSRSMSSSGQNYEPSDAQDLDLELRLSL